MDDTRPPENQTQDPARFESRDQETEPQKLRDISPETLKAILKAHAKWVKSGGEEGTKADVSSANLQGADLQEAELSSADLQGAKLLGCNFQGTIFRGTNLQGADLRATDLQGAELLGANLKEANLRLSDLSEADLTLADLSEADLQGADLYECNLTEAKLIEANLTGANLQEADLAEADLQGAVLYQANLQEANLSEANLEGADLSEADLRGALLFGAKLRKVSVLQATLRESLLQDADLGNAKGILAEQLAGANVSGATLTKGLHEFAEPLKHVEEASKNARKMFLGMLAACVYSILTIATTTDAGLLTNSASSPLPILGTAIPIVGFYWAAPVLLFGLYVYFHLYLHRLWEGLAGLPAVFPDGRPLDKKAYPWLLTGLVRAHFKLLKVDRPPFSRLQEVLSLLLGWWAVPLTLYAFWARYIPRHEWIGTVLHLALLALSTGLGFVFYRFAAATLRGDDPAPKPVVAACREVVAYRYGLIVAGLVILLALSAGAVLAPVPLAKLTLVGYRPYADLRDRNVSSKPENWTGDSSEVSVIRGAQLERMNLRYAGAQYAFLVRASLRSADLSGADLTGADLTDANLSGASLSNVSFWESIEWLRANVYGVENAPEGFFNLAIHEGGAECLESSADWRAVIRGEAPRPDYPNDESNLEGFCGVVASAWQ
jgi:uncharacterized protein YjbI with pentapeptide repeats